MSNKLYKEDTKKKKKKETEIGTFMGRIIYGCTLSLIAILLLIAFFGLLQRLYYHYCLALASPEC